MREGHLRGVRRGLDSKKQRIAGKKKREKKMNGSLIAPGSRNACALSEDNSPTAILSPQYGGGEERSILPWEEVITRLGGSTEKEVKVAREG